MRLLYVSLYAYVCRSHVYGMSVSMPFSVYVARIDGVHWRMLSVYICVAAMYRERRQSNRTPYAITTDNIRLSLTIIKTCSLRLVNAGKRMAFVFIRYEYRA